MIETVLGVQFADLEGWGIPHFGLYWSSIRDELPTYEVQQPLPPQIEGLANPAPQKRSMRLEVLEQPEVRCWYVSGDGRELVQVQRDRFIYNWRKGNSDADYPRYEQFVRPAFERHWSRFVEFLSSQGIARPEIAQAEVTYVNHIPQGQGWESVVDWPSVFVPLSASTAGFLPGPESAQFNFNYLMSDRSGRLRVNANQAVRASDGRQVIVLNLTARGKPLSAETPDILQWLDQGREWIVRGFTDLTTSTMHTVWERET